MEQRFVLHPTCGPFEKNLNQLAGDLPMADWCMMILSIHSMSQGPLEDTVAFLKQGSLNFPFGC